MARKPITTYAGGKGPRQTIWEAIRSLSVAGCKAFTDQDVLGAIKSPHPPGITAGAVREYRRALTAADIVATVRPAIRVGDTAKFALVKDEGVEAPRVRKDGSRVTQGLAQEQMWRTLRMMSGDTNANELVAHASTPAVQVHLAAAADYLQVLFHAGYLIRTKEGHGIGRGGVPARYRMSPGRNTGPRPPMVCRTKVVYDPNEDKIVWQPKISEEEAIYGR